MKRLTLLMTLYLAAFAVVAQTPEDGQAPMPDDEHNLPITAKYMQTSLNIQHQPQSNLENFMLMNAITFADGKSFAPAPGQLSKDGMTYYMSIKNADGHSKLYSVSRADAEAPFVNFMMLEGKINDGNQSNIQPSVSEDGNTIVFVRNKTGLWEDNDLYIATRNEKTGKFDQVREIEELNRPESAEAYPWISPDGKRLYFTTNRGDGTNKLVMAQRGPEGGFQIISMMEDLGMGEDEPTSLWLTNNQLEAYICAGQQKRIYYTRRTSTDEPFQPAELMLETPEKGFISALSMSPDKREVYFYSSYEQDAILRFVHGEDPPGGDASNIVIAQQTKNSDPDSDSPFKDVYVKAYPNPTTSILTIRCELPDEQAGAQVVFYAMDGRVAFREELRDLKGGINNLEFELQNGYYQVVIVGQMQQYVGPRISVIR